MKTPSTGNNSIFERYAPLQIFLLCMGLLFAVQLATVLVNAVIPSLFLAIIIGALGFSIAMPSYLIQRSGGKLVDDLALYPITLRQLLWLIMLSFSVLLPVDFLGELNSHFYPVPDSYYEFLEKVTPHGPLETLLAFLAMSIVAPLGEEILFRGLLQQSSYKIMSVRMAIIYTALIFAALHFEYFFIFGLLAVGILLGFVFEICGSLLASFAVHFIYNTMVLVLVMLDPGETDQSSLLEGPWKFIGLLMSITAMAIAIRGLQLSSDWQLEKKTIAGSQENESDSP